MKKILKDVVILSVLIGVFTTSVYGEDIAEQSAVQTKSQENVQDNSIKPVPHKSFFSRFSKKKAVKDSKDRSTHPVVNEVPLFEASVVYDMDDCIKIGLKNSPYIKTLSDIRKQQKHEVNSAKSNYFPVLNAGTGYNYGYTNYSGNGSHQGFVTRNGYGFDMGLSAMVFDFGRTIAKINMQKYNLEAATYDLEEEVLNTVFDIRVAYTRVLSQRASVDVLLQNVKINELNVERTKAMYDVGLKSKIDLVNAQANLTTAEIALLEGQKNYQTALIDLNSAMYYINAPDYMLKPTDTFNFAADENIKNEINVAYEKKSYGDNELDFYIKEGSIYSAGIEKRSIVDSYKFNPFELSLKEALDKAFADRHDLKSMKLVKRASQESLKAVKRSWYPELNVSAGYGLNVNSNDISDNGNVLNSVSLYGGLDFPMINGMYIKNQIEIAKLNVDKAQNNIDLLENNIYFEVQDLYVTMKQLEQKIPLMRKRVDQFQENFELADGRYAVGLGNYIELQEALTNYNNAQLSFIETVFSYNQARYELEKAMAVEYSAK